MGKSKLKEEIESFEKMPFKLMSLLFLFLQVIAFLGITSAFSLPWKVLVDPAFNTLILFLFFLYKYKGQPYIEDNFIV